MNNTREKGQAPHQSKLDAGQAMVEAMVALSVIVVGILGVFTLTSQSLSLNRVDADRYVAVNLANEGIELVKNLLDKNIMNDAAAWNDLPGFSADGKYEIDFESSALLPVGPNCTVAGSGDCLYFNKKGNGYYRYHEDLYPDDKPTNFSRIINIQTLGGETSYIKVVSTVFWTSRGSSYSFSVQDDFYDLKNFKRNLNYQLGG